MIGSESAPHGIHHAVQQDKVVISRVAQHSQPFVALHNHVEFIAMQDQQPAVVRREVQRLLPDLLNFVLPGCIVL